MFVRQGTLFQQLEKIGGIRCHLLVVVSLGSAWIAPAVAQVPLVGSGPGGVIRIQNTDLAVLEAGDERQDLPCTVSSDKAFLGFDLRFHAGYDLNVPLRELAGSENTLTILFRVYPEGQPEAKKYFMQKVRVPEIEEDAKGDAYLQGAFDLGEGKYQVDWLMRDRTERVCASSWKVEAELSSKERDIAMAIEPNAIEGVRYEQFYDDPPVERAADSGSVKVKILVNFAPQKARAAALRPLDTVALVSMLRTLNREPNIGKYSLVAFNLQEQKILHRQDDADRIDFRALGQSLEELQLGTVDLKRLAEKHGETTFLGDLIAAEFKPGPQAMIFAGPKALLDANIPEAKLREVGDLKFPVFYMNYILNPYATPWRDTIGNAVKFFKGVEYTISRPRDLWFAVSEIMGKILNFRNAKQVAAVSSQ
ncbi:MAG: acetyltransferase [Bryobacteraceae bacterium]